jgi:hypothetical protein
LLSDQRALTSGGKLAGCIFMFVGVALMTARVIDGALCGAAGLAGVLLSRRFAQRAAVLSAASDEVIILRRADREFRLKLPDITSVRKGGPRGNYVDLKVRTGDEFSVPRWLPDKRDLLDVLALLPLPKAY